jgi:hypothetical protein
MSSYGLGRHPFPRPFGGDDDGYAMVAPLLVAAPITAASSTSSCKLSKFPRSSVTIHSPPLLMLSFVQSTIWTGFAQEGDTGPRPESGRRDKNLLPVILECLESYATLGEICGVLRRVFDEHKPAVVL